MFSRYLLGPMLILLFCQQLGFSQHAKELSPGYYVVVAAFSDFNEKGTKKYTQDLNNRGLKAQYGFNSERNYFYVYLKHSETTKPTKEEMTGIRKNEEFAKAWVRTISPYTATKVVSQPTAIVQNVNQVIEERPEPILDSLQDEKFASIASTPPAEEIMKPETFDAPPVDPASTDIFINLYNATNNKTIEGKVKVVDPDKARLIKEVKGNDYLDLGGVKTKGNKVLLICESFGYRKLQQEISYPLPLADTVEEYIDMVGPTFLINFDLVRLNRGDIATLYEVFFFNDAAIMLSQSKFELNSLLEMMQENPKYKVKLHGHTNGNYRGKILVMGDQRNFFSLDGAKKTSGSAKDLSEARATIIKDYLVENGIDPARLEIKAWGGKRPIYDKHSANAKKNVRVEVEILED